MTINLDEPTQRRLEARARKEGRQAEEVAASLVAQTLVLEPTEDRETALLRVIAEGLPDDFWQRKRVLDEKAASFASTPAEYAERSALVAGMERWQVERLEAVAALAALKNATPQAVMRQLGILPV